MHPQLLSRIHWLLIDLIVAGTVAGVSAATVAVHGDPDRRVAAIAISLAAGAVLVVRSRLPTPTLIVCTGLALLLFHLDQRSGTAAMFAPAVALYSVGLTRSRGQQILAAVAAVAAILIADTVISGHERPDFTTLGHIALVAVPLLAAEALRTRRSYISLLLERVELAERTREEEAQRRVEHERMRIARDLHDVVAHTLTTINVQAGVAAHLLEGNPEHARTALNVIEEASREAIDELRAVVGILRDGERDSAPLEPAPTIDAVEALVEQRRRDGLNVILRVDGERPERLPDAVQLAAVRIVQESLTNAQRHAAGSEVWVGLAFQSEQLLVTVENGRGGNECGGGAGLGVGIVGMKERAAVIGGHLDARPSAAGYLVSAVLPYRRAG